jgi:hypothetical protein
MTSWRPVAVAVAVALLAWTGCGSSSPTSDACKSRHASDLVFTELMLDPEGPDNGQEWLEVYNTLDADLPLSGFTLYQKDTDGTGFKAVPLTGGVVPAHGYFVFGDPAAGAFVDSAAGAALGTLPNARGVVGLRCGDLIVDEATWTRVAVPGRSRMLEGGGALPGTFGNDDEQRWCDAPADALYAPGNAGTPGAPNPACPGPDLGDRCQDGQGGALRPLLHPGPGDVFVTEVMARPSAAHAGTGQWLEVQARTDIDLNGVTVANSLGAHDALRGAQCLRLRAGERAVLARSTDPFINGGLPAPLATYQVAFSTLNERVVLRLGDAGLDEADLLPSASGHAWALDPAFLDAAGNDDPHHFCQATGRWSPDGGDYGSPGAPNPPCGAPPPMPAPASRPGCLDPGTGLTREPRPPRAGQVFISEVMADPSSVPDATGEYVELSFTLAADLNGLALSVSSGASMVLESATCLPVPAGGQALLARSDDWWLNGGLPAAAALFTFDLKNSGDRLRLRGPDGGVLDELAWTKSTSGVSLQVQGGRQCLTPEGFGTRYGFGDVGTPGRPGLPCP